MKNHLQQLCLVTYQRLLCLRQIFIGYCRSRVFQKRVLKEIETKNAALYRSFTRRKIIQKFRIFLICFASFIFHGLIYVTFYCNCCSGLKCAILHKIYSWVAGSKLNEVFAEGRQFCLKTRNGFEEIVNGVKQANMYSMSPIQEKALYLHVILRSLCLDGFDKSQQSRIENPVIDIVTKKLYHRCLAGFLICLWLTITIFSVIIIDFQHV